MSMAGSLPPRKKQKTRSAKTVADLEKSITDALNSNASLNPIADLLSIVSASEDAEVTLKAMFALYRVFTLVIQKGILSPGLDEDSDRKAVRVWTSAKLDSFTSVLCSLLASEDKTLRTSALKILFSILRQLSNHIQKVEDPSSSLSVPLQFDVNFFRRIVEALITGSSSTAEESDYILKDDIRDLFLDTWLNVYSDIRWFFFREAGILLDKSDLLSKYPSMPKNILSILEKVTSMSTDASAQQQFWIEGLGTKPKKSGKSKKGADALSDEDEPIPYDAAKDDWRAFFDDPKPSESAGKPKGKSRRIHTMTIHEQLHSASAHRAVFTKCWLTLLPLLSPVRAPDDETGDDDQENLVLVTRALNVLHRGVLPHLTRAVLIMDWVASCVDYGGNVGLLALNALFVLMQEYNLDYPQFYTRLYSFLDRNVLHLKHRPRFFRLTELFLASSHLPATLLASFIKRLSRISLNAPPAAIIMIIPFTYNVLKRHPALMAMIHRTDDVENMNTDPFNASEPNPTLTNAIQSSLWEIYSHRQHYHSTVSTMTRIFEEAFTKPNYAMEDFLDHTYATLFDTEVNRKIKKDPIVLEAEISKPMVVRKRKADTEDSDDEAELASQDVVSTLWVFA